ncbi:aconitase X catalytic domain-containing protein [Mycetocola sp.]|uniref:aconitase X catalytic domain-containing protein n=1 Tax=Mycetocola sp. TaxID=1871042 RepID=UPI00263710B5|nr:aconitase X catalytic domain-containing protein [Mycetocola sp.]
MASTLVLTAEDEAKLSGERGPGVAMAMRIVVALARVSEATKLIDVESAHIDSCLYHGQAGLDFAEKLVRLGARVSVPTTLNVSSLDLMHPGLVRLDAEESAAARRLMDAYVALGARPTWTCAPYQIESRPEAGTDVAWAESNAIVFANSVLGARTARYGDFLDACAAVTGRVPLAGLHLPAERVPTLAVDCSDLPAHVLESEAAWAALGFLVGRIVGEEVSILTGINPASVDEDRLKALGATAASSGGVALFHVAGSTPEARAAGSAWPPDGIRSTVVTREMLTAARNELTTAATDASLDAVSLGTPHFSLTEFEKLAELLREPGDFVLPVWISTSRAVLQQARERGLLEALEAAGARIVVDTCTYLVPILADSVRTTMTTSGKWAWYAPANMGIQVVLGTLAECVASARAGRVIRDDSAW